MVQAYGLAIPIHCRRSEGLACDPHGFSKTEADYLSTTAPLDEIIKLIKIQNSRRWTSSHLHPHLLTDYCRDFEMHTHVQREDPGLTCSVGQTQRNGPVKRQKNCYQATVILGQGH